MNNKAHLRPKDYDSNGDIIPSEIVAGKCPIEVGGNCPLKTQGEWIEDYTAKKKRVVACNKCHCLNIMGKSNFCPNCGADMRKGAI